MTPFCCCLHNALLGYWVGMELCKAYPEKILGNSSNINALRAPILIEEYYWIEFQSNLSLIQFGIHKEVVQP